MKKTYRFILAVSLLTVGASGVYVLQSSAEGPQKIEAPAQNTVAPLLDSKSLQEKMINAIDNYQNVSGSYHALLRPIDVDEIVHFEVQQGANPRSHITVKNNKTSTSQETVFDGEYYYKLDHLNKEYVKRKTDVETAASFDKTSPRHLTKESGEAVFTHRPDPSFASRAGDVIFPQDYGFWLTPNNHQIVGTEKMLGRSVVVVEGKHDDPKLAGNIKQPSLKCG